MLGCHVELVGELFARAAFETGNGQCELFVERLTRAALQLNRPLHRPRDGHAREREAPAELAPAALTLDEQRGRVLRHVRSIKRKGDLEDGLRLRKLRGRLAQKAEGRLALRVARHRRAALEHDREHHGCVEGVSEADGARSGLAQRGCHLRRRHLARIDARASRHVQPLAEHRVRERNVGELWIARQTGHTWALNMVLTATKLRK
eukprot:2275583-Pleurochrysis_carterae.AAC.4